MTDPTVAETPAAQPAAPNRLQISPLVAANEQLLEHEALLAHYRNRTLALAQTLANERDE